VRVTQDAGARCRAAKELAGAGDYEAARDALGDLWDALGSAQGSKVCHQEIRQNCCCERGVVGCWAAQAGSGRQAFAKDLISESIRIFETLGDQETIAEAQSDLALCYWREGGMNEARVWFREAYRAQPSRQTSFASW